MYIRVFVRGQHDICIYLYRVLIIHNPQDSSANYIVLSWQLFTPKTTTWRLVSRQPRCTESWNHQRLGQFVICVLGGWGLEAVWFLLGLRRLRMQKKGSLRFATSNLARDWRENYMFFGMQVSRIQFPPQKTSTTLLKKVIYIRWNRQNVLFPS